MRTINGEVGSGPIRVVTHGVGKEVTGSIGEDNTKGARLDSGERIVIPIPHNTDITSGLDGRREICALNLAGGPTPQGALVATVDNGPDIRAANDNNVLARLKLREEIKTDPFRELYARGELGINETENRRHWFDSQRFKKVHADARGEPENDTAQDNWRELMLEFFEGLSSHTVTSFAKDKGVILNDDMEFTDSTSPAHCEVIDNAGWVPTRDLAPHAHQHYAQKVVALLADVLGDDYKVLGAAIERGWTSQQIGETEGYTNRASASACGKGMLRSALRNLSRFYVYLDRLEERVERPPDIWPLVGAYTWPPVRYTSGHHRTQDAAKFMNQAAGPVLRGTPNVYRGISVVSTPPQSRVLH